MSLRSFLMTRKHVMPSRKLRFPQNRTNCTSLSQWMLAAPSYRRPVKEVPPGNAFCSITFPTASGSFPRSEKHPCCYSTLLLLPLPRKGHGPGSRHSFPPRTVFKPDAQHFRSGWAHSETTYSPEEEASSILLEAWKSALRTKYGTVLSQVALRGCKRLMDVSLAAYWSW